MKIIKAIGAMLVIWAIVALLLGALVTSLAVPVLSILYWYSTVGLLATIGYCFEYSIVSVILLYLTFSILNKPQTPTAA